MKGSESLVELLISADRLKRTLRFSNCPDYARDSSADHSWMLALMVINVAEQFKLDLDIFHAVKLALYHDLPEYLTGDFTLASIKRGEITAAQKLSLEKSAAKSIRDRYESGDKIFQYWNEFEENRTRESRYVRALDRIEAISHLISVGYSGKDEFEAEITATGADRYVKEFPELMLFLKEVKLKLKEVFKQSGFKWKHEYNFPGLEI